VLGKGAGEGREGGTDPGHPVRIEHRKLGNTRE
jgi:hypothetical protein